MDSIKNRVNILSEKEKLIHENYQKIVGKDYVPISQDWVRPGDNFKKLSIYKDAPVVATSNTTLICKL